MKDYVKMYVMDRHSEALITLVSEEFPNEIEATYFSEVFHHNYGAKVRVVETFNVSKYVVFAYDVNMVLIRSNFVERTKEFEFANWKYITRGNF